MRTAFQLWPALDHRNQASRISSVAVTENGSTLYLGLSDGQIEEHSISHAQPGVRTSLRARKHFGKKVSSTRFFNGLCYLAETQLLLSCTARELTSYPGWQPIQDICHLYSAQRLAILCDGQLQLADQELLHGRSIPNVKVIKQAVRCFCGLKCPGTMSPALLCVQAVSAIAVNPWAQYPPRIAVAMRANKRNVRVMVFEVQAAADSTSPFDPSALCIHQVNVAESLTIKVQTSSWTLSKLYAPPKHNHGSGSI